MKPVRIPLSVCLIALLALTACSGGSGNSDAAGSGPAGSQDISGEIVGGLRVLTIDPTARDQVFTIYRGDYVKAQTAGGDTFLISIPSLDVEKRFPVTSYEKAYFKVPNAGTFAFTAGDAAGEIRAIEYAAQGYREVGAQEAAEFIANVDPLILDVRTPREFSGGHIEDAMLLPVQVFQYKVAELAEHQNDPILVYCRTGNRSTVAAKILVDHGFTNVVNMRRGIVEWVRLELPVVQ